MCSYCVYIPSFVSLRVFISFHVHNVILIWECIQGISTLVFSCDLYSFPLVKDKLATANATVRANRTEEIKLTRALQAAERRVETEQVKLDLFCISIAMLYIYVHHSLRLVSEEN